MYKYTGRSRSKLLLIHRYISDASVPERNNEDCMSNVFLASLPKMETDRWTIAINRCGPQSGRTQANATSRSATKANSLQHLPQDRALGTYHDPCAHNPDTAGKREISSAQKGRRNGEMQCSAVEDVHNPSESTDNARGSSVSATAYGVYTSTS